MDEPDDITLAVALHFAAWEAANLASRLLYGNPTDQECWRVASLLGDTGRLCQNRPPAD